MKRIAILVTILSLVVIAIFEVIRWKRFQLNPEYDYAVSDSVDANYHNPQAVLEYYETAFRVGDFAREMWFSEDIDVKNPDNGNKQSMSATHTYRQLLAKAKALEGKLVLSQKLKNLGLDNDEIKRVEDQGLSIRQVLLIKHFGSARLKKGDQGKGIWELQTLLNKMGYKMPIDGNFAIDTENGIRAYQQSIGLTPTGIADEAVLSKLLEKF